MFCTGARSGLAHHSPAALQLSDHGGLGAVVQGRPRQARREAYAKSVTYCTNKELAFDYLRDGVVLERRNSRLHLSLESLRGDVSRDDQLVLRGLCYAIMAGSDSVVI